MGGDFLGCWGEASWLWGSRGGRHFGEEAQTQLSGGLAVGSGKGIASKLFTIWCYLGFCALHHALASLREPVHTCHALPPPPFPPPRASGRHIQRCLDPTRPFRPQDPPGSTLPALAFSSPTLDSRGIINISPSRTSGLPDPPAAGCSHLPAGGYLRLELARVPLAMSPGPRRPSGPLPLLFGGSPPPFPPSLSSSA